jgi:hypothetical protein
VTGSNAAGRHRSDSRIVPKNAVSEEAAVPQNQAARDTAEPDIPDGAIARISPQKGGSGAGAPSVGAEEVFADKDKAPSQVKGGRENDIGTSMIHRDADRVVVKISASRRF